MSKLHIIIGSTRPGRAADLFALWVVDRAKNHGGHEATAPAVIYEAKIRYEAPGNTNAVPVDNGSGSTGDADGRGN